MSAYLANAAASGEGGTTFAMKGTCSDMCFGLHVNQRLAAVLNLCSEKMGRSRKVHSGQREGAAEPRFLGGMPATKVPCAQAALDRDAHTPSRAFATAS